MIITLCGSARFESWFHLWNKVLSLAGHAVFALGAYPSMNSGGKDWYTSAQKEVLDAVHLDKIAASEAVLVLNPFAYIGESTLREIDFAMTQRKQQRKQLFFLESWGKGLGIGAMHTETIRKVARRFDVPVGYGSPIETCAFPSPWDRHLLGPAGEERSALVRLVEAHAAEVRA
jgi:hypothetical protein